MRARRVRSGGNLRRARRLRTGRTLAGRGRSGGPCCFSHCASTQAGGTVIPACSGHSGSQESFHLRAALSYAAIKASGSGVFAFEPPTMVTNLPT